MPHVVRQNEAPQENSRLTTWGECRKERGRIILMEMKRRDILMETMNTLFYNRSRSLSCSEALVETEFNPGLVQYDPACFVPFKVKRDRGQWRCAGT